MTLTTVGPQPVDGAPVGPYVHIGSRWDRRDWLVHKHTNSKTRIKTATQVANGNWSTVWPDLSQTPEAPSVANLVEMGVNHWAAIGGAVLPSVRVPVQATEDRTQGKRGARKRERRLRELWECSNTSEIASLLWADYAISGSAVLGTWVNFEEDDPAKRNPYFIRYDPRHTYILKDNLGNITEMLVARKIDRLELKAMLPDEWKDVFKDSGPEDVEEWFWFTRDRFFYALVDISKDGRKANRGIVLVDEENELGFVPAYEAVRPTADGERRGVFDQTIHMLHTMHRLMTLTIASTEEHAFPTILEYDTVNPGQFGPGAIIHARSAESKLERIAPATHFDVKDLIARLEESARGSATYPQQLSGEPGGSIVSARGINASMGALDARLALAHKQFEVLFGKVSGFLLAMDETYCDGPKTILGDYRDNREAEAYTPSRDVGGAWAARATYGIGAGSDPANIEARISMHLASRLISRETGREQLPFLDDPEKEAVMIVRETFQDALLAGIIAMAAQGQPMAAAEGLKLMQTDDVDLDELVTKMIEVLSAPPPGAPGAGGDPAAEAGQAAESLARGGIPGNAEQGPAGLGLPPMAQLMGQDARMVV